MRSRPLTLAAAVLVLGAATGCGTAHKVATAAKAVKTVAAAAQDGNTPDAGPLADVKLRVVNLFVKNGAPGPALDVYDVLPSPYLKTKPTPVITNLAYGAFSDYIQPHETVLKVVQLYAMSAGSDPIANASDALEIGGLTDDGSGAQGTIELTGSNDQSVGTSPIAGINDSFFVEKGDDGDGGRKGPLAPPPDSGTAELLVSTAPLDNLLPGSHTWYFFVDDSCKPPLNGDPNVTDVPDIFAADGQAPVSSFAVFGTTPASHHLTAVGIANESASLACADLKTKEQGGVDVALTAGQQDLAFVYGTSVTDLHIAVAPVGS